MKLVIESTEDFALWGLTPCRIWRATHEESNSQALVLVATIAVPEGEATEAFERELVELQTPELVELARSQPDDEATG